MILKNPFFLVCCSLFWINQGIERLGVTIPLVHSYFDDLLAMPVVLGITLQIMQWLYPSGNQLTFSKPQVLVGWVYFSIILELFLPWLSPTYTADIWDVLCYGIGSIAFYRWVNKPKQRHLLNLKHEHRFEQADNLET